MRVPLWEHISGKKQRQLLARIVGSELVLSARASEGKHIRLLAPGCSGVCYSCASPARAADLSHFRLLLKLFATPRHRATPRSAFAGEVL